MWYDGLFAPDTTTNPDTYAFKTDWVPAEYVSGAIAESWEQTDQLTVVVRIRKGVYWQDKAPANGRELTADDIAQHYSRLAGTGYGYTKPSAFAATMVSNIESVTATDTNTVTFKFKTANLVSWNYIQDFGGSSMIEAPEWAALDDTARTDWHNVIGTGPWILSDFIDGGSITYTKNTNYWGYDERYPKNKLPYADSLNQLCIPDSATAIAALRTGKLDMLTGIDATQKQSLDKANSNFQSSLIPGTGAGVIYNLKNAPFTDLKVRKALQMAMDINTIAKSHYGGIVDPVLCGPINPIFTDYAYLYSEWSQDLKGEYSYNPTKAKELLSEAGFPDGFKTTLVCASTGDIELLQIIKAELTEIGVDVTTSTMDMASYTQYIMTAKEDAMAGPDINATGLSGRPWQSLLFYSSLQINPYNIKDSVYDEMCQAALSQTDATKFKQQIKEADKYQIENHYVLMVCPTTGSYTMWQPNLKGYAGEQLYAMGYMGYYAQWWKTQ